MSSWSWIQFENPVAIWWIALTSASFINFAFWFWTRVYKFPHQKFKNLFVNPLDPKNIIWYSMIYVFVCAFRSWFPRADVQRICLWDTWLSSVFLGRTLATVAELAFIFQWTLVLLIFGKAYRDHFVVTLSKIIFPAIVIAELFSWYAVITTHYLGNAIEESLWAFSYFLIFLALMKLMKSLKGPLRLACSFSIFGCFLYVLFMVTVDVPMYVQRYLQDLEAQKPLLGFWEGLVDLNHRWVVTHSIQDWKTEIPWQTLYFTIAVLISIALCYLPLEKMTQKKDF